MEISPGAIIAGRYRADHKIGAGAMGEVWSGENISVGYKVAIKAMLEGGALDHEVVARFKREAYILGKIKSDYVARVLDFALDEKFGLVLILDLIEGEVFSNTLKRTKLTVEEAIEIGFDVVAGLVDLHNANIVHRDLKPSNIILQPRADGGQRAIIVDFGVSRLMKSDDPDEEITNITRADMALGTLEYMAPEQMLDSRNVTGGSDLYAVGAMLFRAVKGHHAFGNLADIELARKKLLEETPPLETGRDDEIAKGFEACVRQALRRKPADRYKRAEDMLADLRDLREMMLHPGKQVVGRKQMDSMIEDEPTYDMGADLFPVELSASFQVDRPTAPSQAKLAALAKPSSPGARPSGSGIRPAVPEARASAPTTRQPSPAAGHPAPTAPTAPAARQPDPSTTSPTMPPTAPAQSPFSAFPLPPGTPTFDSTPPRRSGVAVGLVVFLVLLALAGGVALGVTVIAGEHESSGPTAASAGPSASAAAATTATPPAAANTATSADAGSSDASSDASGDASSDASSDAAARDGGPSPYPFPQFAPKQPPGGPLPGRPMPGGGPLPGAPSGGASKP